MPVLFVGIFAVVIAAIALWRGWRRRFRNALGISAAFAGAALLIVGVVGVSVYVWAINSTDTSQFARALIWGDSGFGDQDQFPSRPMPASSDPVIFRSASDSPATAYVDGEHNAPLEQVLESTDSTAFIVLHDDQLLYEGYFNGSTRESIQTSFSVAKSFIATLVGIAIEEGLIENLDDPLTTYLPELLDRDTRFEDITLRHLITMSSGLSFDDGPAPWNDPANTYHGTNLRSAAIKMPRIEDRPGVVFDYNDWNVILLGMVLERAG